MGKNIDLYRTSMGANWERGARNKSRRRRRDQAEEWGPLAEITKGSRPISFVYSGVHDPKARGSRP
ncbi:uncharacterized protein G2W53_017541 [Senna tora]|uniref:Uncharacterized protein n=1 Tax=Senna tora TaxID=362788 RepID=A0A834TS37_9FABA|nr:uncharacterized protein G2W53_017541 [Senna tora]